MKVLFVYSNFPCVCTEKYTFQLSKAVRMHCETDVIFYKDLTDEVVQAYDAIILQRVGTAYLSEALKQNLIDIINRNKDKRSFIYIIDDLVFEANEGLPKKLIENCNAVFCTSNTLAKYVGTINKNVFKFNIFMDIDKFDVINKNSFSKFTIAWASTNSLGKDIIKEIIKNKADINIDFDMIIMGRDSYEFDGISGIYTYPIVNEAEMIKIIKGADILLNPMAVDNDNKKFLQSFCSYPVSEFVNSKTEIKYIISAISRSFLLTSPTATYVEAVDNGVTGMFVEDNALEWIKAIKYVYSNQEIAKIVVKNAYEDVKQRYDEKVVARNVYELIKNIVC